MENDPLNSLNSRQKEAVLATEGPLLILAGAGAGKTKTIAERIRHLVRKGVAPSQILAITFTNKAAKEMRDRVEKMLAEDTAINKPVSVFERPFVSTFHSLGVHILKEQSTKIGLRRHFSIFDREDSKKAVKESLDKAGLDTKTHEPNKIMSVISKEKGRGMKAEDFAVNGASYFANVVGQVWTEYEKILARDNALDFDDLLVRTRDVLRDNPEIRDYYRSIWKYIHIDEYQDTNRVQYEIAQLLVGKEHNICVVGDIDQSIYSWRGADIKNLLDFEKDYPEAVAILLEENYRSTKTILDAANAVIEKNKLRRKKNLFTSQSFGEKISVYSGFDEVSEAEFIAEKTKSLIKEGTPAEEVAVLYRANFQSRVLEEAFMRHGIPYQMIGTRFFERKEVKDIISYLRAGLDPECLSDLKRIINVPARGIGKATIVKIFSGMESDLPATMKRKISDFRELLKDIGENIKKMRASEIIAYIIRTSGLEMEWRADGEEGAARLENAYELVSFAARYDHLSGEEGVEAFLTDAALQSDQDEMREDGKAVRLMTVHASKGLEFDVVFISGLEDGLFPHERRDANLTPAEAEEERRLFYVAITRAKKKVYLSYAQVRMVFGSREVNMPSEFISDIPDELTEEETMDEDGIPRKPLIDISW
jgi:DNA helicase II / ATP-dependent DNA helicase PcrA